MMLVGMAARLITRTAYRSALRRRHAAMLAGLAAATLACVLSTELEARADSWTIKNPGEHLHYSFELEPEAVFVFGRSLNDGPGAGVRGSIPLVDAAFVPSINDNIGITFGIDKDPLTKGKGVNVPVALQWNFFLTDHWSVTGEPGIFFQIDDNGTKANFQVWGGARYHFNDAVALMMRVSLPAVPAFSLGVSFFF